MVLFHSVLFFAWDRICLKRVSHFLRVAFKHLDGNKDAAADVAVVAVAVAIYVAAAAAAVVAVAVAIDVAAAAVVVVAVTTASA